MLIQEIISCSTVILKQLDTGKETTPESYATAFGIAKQLTKVLQPFTMEINKLNDTYTQVHLFFMLLIKVNVYGVFLFYYSDLCQPFKMCFLHRLTLVENLPKVNFLYVEVTYRVLIQLFFSDKIDKFNSLPDNEILDWYKLKQIADDISKCIYNGK